jgi:lysophospholipase L1-like esterase
MTPRRVPYLLVLVLLCTWSATVRAQLQPNDLIAICGDSITEQKLYSVYIETYLLACSPQPDLRAMQFGWGGEVSWGFLERMESDVLRYKPTVATTCYGMNDGGYGPLADDRATKYREAMTNVVKKFKDGGVRFVVVGSPGAVDSDTFRKDPAQAEVYNKTLSQLRDTCKAIAAEQGVAFADVYAPMMQAMADAKKKYGPAYHVCGADGVHPAANGHLVMAYAFLKALGCDGDIGTITIDLAGGKSEASAGHKVIESSTGTVEVLSERYPFCFYGEPSSPDATSGVIEFLPFNRDLNRFTLVVKNVPGPRAKVTWGRVSKEFSSVELAKGINLAAEFPTDNPFASAFKTVEAAVREQQNYETPMIKQFAHNLRPFKQMVPAEVESLNRIADAMAKRDAELQQAARDAVKPVRHTIVVESVR